MRLWYDRPAEEWVEALPLGNGRIEGNAFSNPDRDMIMLMRTPFGQDIPGIPTWLMLRYIPKLFALIKRKQVQGNRRVYRGSYAGPIPSPSSTPWGPEGWTFLSSTGEALRTITQN